MQNEQIAYLKSKLRAKHAVMKQVDEKLIKQLAKKEILQQLDDFSSIASESQRLDFTSHEESNSLSQSASINSSFLRKEINLVHEFMHPKQKQNRMDYGNEKQSMNHNKTDYEDLKYIDRSKGNDTTKEQTDLFKNTIKNDRFIDTIFHKQALQTAKLQQSNAKKQMMNFLDMRENMRRAQLQKQRLEIRQKLLKQQKQLGNQSKQIPNKSYYNKSTFVPENNCLRIERTKKFGSILRQIRKGKTNMINLLERTKIYTSY